MRMQMVIAIGVLGAALAVGEARADGKLTVTKSGQTVEHVCEAGGEVAILGSRNEVTLRGDCGKVAVSGSENSLRIASAAKLAVTGSRNTAGVEAVDRIAVSGSDNRVSYVKGRGKKKPKAATTGKRNVVEKVVALEDAPTGGTEDDGPAANGTLEEAKPIICEKSERVTLDGVLIKTDGIAVTTQGSCRLVITNSKLVSTGSAALQTMGSSVVTLDNVELEGKWSAAMNAGSADVTIKRSTLRGGIAIEGSSTVRLEGTAVHGGRSVTRSATYVDGGGNVFHDK